ncbi:MAG: hypothetical protein ACOCXT_06500 [Candidatus Dojkabacteria bacterium]
MKKYIFSVLVIVVLTAFAFTPAWENIYGYFGRQERTGSTSLLSVESLAGEYRVFIDGEERGEVADKGRTEIVKITPGKREVRLERNYPDQDFFYTLTRQVEFLPSSEVQIVWEAGPTLESSNGNIKYFTRIHKPRGAEIYIIPFPQTAKVEFDSRHSEKNLFEIFDTNLHTIRITNGEGFEPQSVQVNLQDGQNGKLLTNLKLVVEVYLYKYPFH